MDYGVIKGNIPLLSIKFDHLVAVAPGNTQKTLNLSPDSLQPNFPYIRYIRLARLVLNSSDH